MADYKNIIICCDVETGGLPSSLKKIATHEVALTEIAFVAIDLYTLEIVDKDSWLIKPYSDELIYDPQAAIASNITKEMCEESGEDIKDVFKKAKTFLKKNKVGTKKPYLSGQNIIKFDYDFIKGFFELNNEDISKYFDDFIIDTMNWSRLKWPEEGKHNLNVITERCNLEHTQAHRALPDTVITAKVVIDFLKCLRGNGSSAAKEEKKEERFRVTFEI
jgi:DNA polymerase III alpha subunit (gram-positive type)